MSRNDDPLAGRTFRRPGFAQAQPHLHSAVRPAVRAHGPGFSRVRGQVWNRMTARPLPERPIPAFSLIGGITNAQAWREAAEKE